MVKTSANPNAKGKATASSSALPAAKTTPRKVRPKVFKKKAKADPEKQKVVASEAATTAEVASAPSLKLAEVSPAATVAKENGGQKMKMSKNEKMKVEEGERMKGTEKMSRNEKVEVGEKMKGNEKGRIKEKEKNGEKARERKSEAGFIFMCSGKTKPECFRNGVFGLPKGKIDAVEKIRPGAKLFLYDFDLKLLYGVYKAKTKGGLDLVRSAFHGKFPAQVKFKVDRDCLPLPESSFKHAIKENYNSKGKFTQELSPRQVHRLLELFKPVNLPQPSLQYVEERHRLDVSEGRIPQYVEETRVPRHVEEMHQSRAVEEMRLPYDYEERRWPRYVEDIEHPRFLEERDPLCSQYITHLPELQHAPPTYYHRVAPSDNWYYQPQVDIMYERSAPRAIVEATDREPLLARDYRVPEELVARLDHVDELYRSYRLASRAMDLDHGPSYVTAAYENLRPAYSESIQRPVSTRANVPGVPVSSLYSFAGAPAYR